VRIKEEYIIKRVFKTIYVNYEFMILQFELSNVPTIFMSLMNGVFNKYLNMFVIFFVDDILIYCKSEK
jgi:hypothetical protein